MITNRRFIISVTSFFSLCLFFTTFDFSFASVLVGMNQIAFNEQRKFIGQEYDADTGLNYLNARYYDAKRGQFISQDPNFWKPETWNLADPQSLNSYSYANNNPIRLSDPNGLWAIGISFDSTYEVGLGIASEYRGERGHNVYNATSQSYGVTFVWGKSFSDSGLALTYTNGNIAGDNGNYKSAVQPVKNVAPIPLDKPFAFGASGGTGLSGNFSPFINNISDLNGASNNLNINNPLISGSTSTNANGAPSFSVSTGLLGKSWGLSVSSYPTKTSAVTILTGGTIIYGANTLKNTAVNVYQNTLSYIQGRVSVIQSQINSLSQSRKKNP